MSTALTLTPQPSTASVLLQVTGAPSATTTVYNGTFETGTADSWTSTKPLYAQADSAHSGAYGLNCGAADVPGAADTVRTITGLTIGHTYRLRAWVRKGYGSQEGAATLAVTGVAGSTTINLPGPSLIDRVWAQDTFTWVATATSHQLVIGRLAGGNVTDIDDVTVDDVPPGLAPTTITRVDSNGARPVRLLDGQEPISGTLTVADYEPALTGTIRYDVRDGLGVTTSTSTTLDGTVTTPQLHVPVLPQYRASLALVTGYDAARESSSTVHHVIGRADPVVTIGPLRTRAGTLTIWAPDHPTAADVEALADIGEVLMLRQPTHPGMDLYLVATTVAVRPDPAQTTPRRWEVTIGYVEVAAPAGPLLGAVGWTYAQIATYTSFATLPATFATFADLTVGP